MLAAGATMSPVPSTFELALAGPGGEPVDLTRTIMSHGVADLPPGRVDEADASYTTTLALDGMRPRTVRIGPGRPGFARVDVRGARLGARAGEALAGQVRRILNLEEDLSGFYALAAGDPELAWATRGAGRMLRTPTVFEAVVKTICTTNCAWSATVRMVTALVEGLGEPAAGGARAFPTPAAMAAVPEGFYRDVVRAGYRSRYLAAVAAGAASGELELEALAEAPPDELPDGEVAARLLALPGIGPYGAAHMMMLLGRHSQLILDSWTRPKYARLNGRKATDAQMARRFRRYGRYAGLAFWLYLTRDWVADVSSA
jgi:3-methyladenine DNA glycosylase/8-oxoguanine DNA glycosylase